MAGIKPMGCGIMEPSWAYMCLVDVRLKAWWAILSVHRTKGGTEKEQTNGAVYV